MEVNTIQDEAKQKLLEVYKLAIENPSAFQDSNVHIHVGTILNKFFGGINEQTVAPKQTKTKYNTFKPTIEDFKKKPKPQQAVAEDEDKEKIAPLESLSLPELKVKAKSLGLKYSNKEKEELIRDIYHHEMHLEAERKEFKKSSAIEGAKGANLVVDTDDDFVDEETLRIAEESRLKLLEESNNLKTIEPADQLVNSDEQNVDANNLAEE